MKRIMALVLMVGLVGGYVGASEALAKKKKLVPKDVKFFLRDDNACEDPNFLSIEDGEDVGCWQFDSFLNEVIIDNVGLFGPELVAQIFETRDGVPLTLDATKTVTGEISTYSGNCLDAAIPCAPVGVGAGQATIDITLTATAAGTETILGEQSETFTVVPGDPNTFDLNIELDDALNKKKFDSLKLSIYPHGVALFHSGVEMENPASFLTVPTLAKK